MCENHALFEKAKHYVPIFLDLLKTYECGLMTVCVLCLFFMVPGIGLQYLIVIFPNNTCTHFLRIFRIGLNWWCSACTKNETRAYMHI